MLLLQLLPTWSRVGHVHCPQLGEEGKVDEQGRDQLQSGGVVRDIGAPQADAC